jgi:hypothetical protein
LPMHAFEMCCLLGFCSFVSSHHQTGILMRHWERHQPHSIYCQLVAPNTALSLTLCSHTPVTKLIGVQCHPRVARMGGVECDLWWHHATFLEPMGLQGRARSHHTTWVSCLPTHWDCRGTQLLGCTQTAWWG